MSVTMSPHLENPLCILLIFAYEFGLWLFQWFFSFEVLGFFWSLQTSIMCIVGELGGSVAMANGIRDRWQVTSDRLHATLYMWQVTCDRWNVTCDTCHATPDTWHMIHDIFFLSVHLWGFFLFYSVKGMKAFLLLLMKPPPSCKFRSLE